MYIRATGNISAQKTFGHPAFLTELVAHTGNRLHCIEPDYKTLIDIKLIRRMSRIIRMGVAAAMECLQEAGVSKPDAIVTGTAYGCLEDTGVFLSRMVEFNESLLTPTAFIQSTHNTIGAQIGLMLQCNHYNNTFVHRGFSFESALLDGMMLLQEGEAGNVLVGAIDEITDISFAILNRLGLYKQTHINNLELFTALSKGTIAGEGSVFFLLAHQPSGNDYARLTGMKTFYKPRDSEEMEQQILQFLESNATSMDDIDLLIIGINGDNRSDRVFDQLAQTIFKNKSKLPYKHLCGEYPTATAFAMWMAAKIIQTGTVPSIPGFSGAVVAHPKKILIYNHYLQVHHSLLLLSAC